MFPGVVLSVPTVGIPRTTLWYCSYRALVLLVPTVGIIGTNRWYGGYHPLTPNVQPIETLFPHTQL